MSSTRATPTLTLSFDRSPSLCSHRFSSGRLTLLRQKFSRTLEAIWQKGGTKNGLGLAISGGVDSMALASLCSEASYSSASRPSFMAFIVDHGLRENSAQEAEAVAKELQCIKIDAEVLQLDWQSHSNTGLGSKIESAARTLRYQALGRACFAHDIHSLLVAHHADDQAETVLLRLLGGYWGSGLRGIKPEARIPDCEAIYGLRDSGNPRQIPPSIASGVTQSTVHREAMLTEDGGVKIARPLLHFRKDDLIAICEESAVKWFEDHTNADRSLTTRNTVRYLHRQSLLPMALRQTSLCTVADRIQSRDESVDRMVDEAFGCMEIELDFRNGSVRCSFEPASLLVAGAAERQYHVASALVRKVFALVSPVDAIALQELHDAVTLLMPRIVSFHSNVSGDGVAQAMDVAGVHIRRSSPAERSFTILRSRPNTKEKRDMAIELIDPGKFTETGAHISMWSDWHLWDGRYWLRVCVPANIIDKGVKVFVRFLTSQDLASMRRKMDAFSVKRLNNALRHAAPGPTRFTLPAIVSGARDQEEIADTGGSVIALPSLGWCAGGWCQWHGRIPADSWLSTCFWDIRFKHIDCDRTSARIINLGGRQEVVKDQSVAGSPVKSRDKAGEYCH